MIEAFSLKTAHFFGDALASQARLRHRVFVERRGLSHSFFDGMEFDEFDTPAAVYLVWRDQQAIVRGLMRASPTSMPYMLKSYWPFLCETRELPVCADIWEVTRVCVDRELPACADIWEVTRVCVDREFDATKRKRIFPKLLCALQELFRLRGVGAMIGVTRPPLLNFFLRDGVEWLGQVAEIEGEMEAAFWVPTKFLRPEGQCRILGIGQTVLTLEPLQPGIAA